MNNSNFQILMNVAFAFFIGASVTSVALSSYKSYKKTPFRPSFIYKGFLDYSIEELKKESEESEVPEKELFKDVGVPPVSAAINFNPSPDGLSANAAAKIGMVVLASKYGHNFINSQKPFQVTLLENRVWKVKGTKNNNISHATSEIYIQKVDAQILRIIRNSK